MDKWTKIPNNKIISQVIEALKKNGIETFLVNNKDEAKAKVLELIPKGSEVMTMTSKTLETSGIADVLNNSGEFDSVRNKLKSMDRNTQNKQMKELGAAPNYAVGSVHAITKQGQVLIASASGSQLPAYVYGAEHVIWIAGAHKIVETLEDGIQRLYEHILPLESERVRQVYGMPKSSVNKLLIYNQERPGKL